MSSILNFNGNTAVSAPGQQRLQVYTERQFDRIPQLRKLPAETRLAMRVVANVLPFRVNQYVLDELINWDDPLNDPLFQLTFPQQGMLAPEDFQRMAELVRADAPKAAIQRLAREIQERLNPHPAGQMQMNTPVFDGEPIPGVQHKYRETVLFFPTQGQVCHSYCSFCFRWAQFVGDKRWRMATSEGASLHQYLAQQPAVSDLLLTGGDPMVMKTRHLADYLRPLTRSQFDHVQSVRIGTKALSFWPQRFVTDEDADQLLYLFEDLVGADKHVALMAHYNHWRELDTDMAREAIRRVRDTGAEIRSQAPLLAHINDDPEVWARLWHDQVRLGIIPYYMFVERDTGARRYFEVPLVRAWEVYRQAMQQVSGLARTARGPSMSAGPGKVEVQGVADIHGERVLVLRFIQARNPDWVQRPFFAAYDDRATWLNELRPAFGEERFFFEDEYARMRRGNG